MNLSPNLPPNIDEIKAAIPDIDITKMVFTYGDTVYNVPLDVDGHPIPLSPHLEVHERVHIQQQTASDTTPALWWSKWLTDDDFKLQQELEAYAKQYAFVRGFAPMEQCAQFLFQLAGSLSSDYGLPLSLPEAESKIRNKAKAL